MADVQPDPKATPTPIEKTAKDVKEDLNRGNVAAGTDALRQGYLDYMKTNQDGSQFWSQLRTAGHFTDADMQTLSLGFAQKNFASVSDSGYVTADSINKFEGTVRNQGNTPESQFAQQMSEYMKTAMQSDDFHHFRFGFGGNWADESQLKSRIDQLNVQDQGRASAGDMARALDKAGPDGRTLFEKLANGHPAILPSDLAHAKNNLGAYTPEEQATIKSMLKGTADSGSPEGIAMGQLQNPDQNNKITRDRLNAVEAATAPIESPVSPGQTAQDVPKKGIEALGAMTQAQLAQIAPNGGVTRDSVDKYLQDKNNPMSVNSRQALQNLRDSLPADNKPTALSDLGMAGGYKTQDGKFDVPALKAQEAKVQAEARGTLAGLHDNVTAASITDAQQKAITPDSITASMKALEAKAAQPGGVPVAQNDEYQALQRLKTNFNDISADGKTITPADIARYAAESGAPFQGFKGDAPAQPAQPPAQPGQLPPEVQAQAEKDAQALMGAAGSTEKLGRGPIIDQAMQILQKRAKDTGEQVTPQAGRQLLADMAKANHWPGTEAQWGAYVQDGSTKHLPKELNGAMRAGMDMIVPGTKLTPEQQHAVALQAGDSRVPAVDLGLKPEQVAAVKDALKAKSPDQAAAIDVANPQQINDFVASNPAILGDKLTPEQAGLIGQRNTLVAAYAKAVEEAMQKLQAQAPAPPDAPPPAQPPAPADQPPPRHHRRRHH